MTRTTQTACLRLLASALVGVTASVRTNDGEARKLTAGNDDLAHLQPGDTVTIKIESDERWLKAQADAADRQQPADLEAEGRATMVGDDLSGGSARLTPTDSTDPQAGHVDDAGPGGVIADTGATRSRSTRTRG